MCHVYKREIYKYNINYGLYIYTWIRHKGTTYRCYSIKLFQFPIGCMYNYYINVFTYVQMFTYRNPIDVHSLHL